jgi:hypothetical protein
MNKVTGNALNIEWGVNAQHALYRNTGKFYMPLERFPGAMFDNNGYLVFVTEMEYKNSPHLKFYETRAGRRVAVPKGLKNIPGYVLKPN